MHHQFTQGCINDGAICHLIVYQPTSTPWPIAGQHEAERRWVGCRIVRWASIVDVVLRSRERRAGEAGWIGWLVR